MAEQSKSTSLGLPQIKKADMNVSTANWKSTQYMPGIATEVESEWIEKLYEKFKEIDNLKGLIQTGINDLDKDYVEQKQQLNDSFDAMINVIEERRKILLNEMSDKVVKYKKDLTAKLEKMTIDRGNLTEIKSKYEANIKNEELTDIEERENENVKMISDALKTLNIKSTLKPKHPQFIMNQKSVNQQLNNLGAFILKTEIPDAPKVSVLVRTSESALIEVLMDQKYNEDPVLKYELNVYKGPLDESEYDNVKDNEYLKLYCKAVQDDNICFYKIGDLDDNETYNIRLRAVLKDDNITGEYSKWLTFITKGGGSDDEDNKEDVIPYTAEDEQKLEAAWKDREVTHFESWLVIFDKVDLGLDTYKQKRMFFCMQQVEQGPGSKIDGGDFANFILSVGPRFDSNGYKNMCKVIKDKILSQ